MAAVVVAYTIVTGINIAELSEKTNNLIKSGWEPTGGPVVAPPLTSPQVLIQALVKTDTK